MPETRTVCVVAPAARMAVIALFWAASQVSAGRLGSFMRPNNTFDPANWLATWLHRLVKLVTGTAALPIAWPL